MTVSAQGMAEKTFRRRHTSEHVQEGELPRQLSDGELLKNECYYGREDEFDTKEKLVDMIKEYISFYNGNRIQVKLGGLSPVDYRLAHEANVK